MSATTSPRTVYVDRDHPNYNVATALDVFFARKKWHCGGKIPRRAIHTYEHYNLLRRINLEAATIIGYRSIARHLAAGLCLAKTPTRHEVDIFLLLRVLKNGAQLGIAQMYFGGLFLLYLKLCEKVEVA